MKTCKTCGADKPLDEFYRLARAPDGLNPHCRECQRASKRAWYSNPKAKALSQAQRKRARARPLPPDYALDPALHARFWEKVDKGDGSGCWNWIGAHSRGYGMLWNGSRNETCIRLVLKMHGTEVPDGMHVDHTCRNKRCVRPDHLRVVTPSINAIENNTSPIAKNAAKTHCNHGHELTDENTAYLLILFKRAPRTGIIRPAKNIGRQCLTCRPWYATNPRRIFVVDKPDPNRVRRYLQPHSPRKRESNG